MNGDVKESLDRLVAAFGADDVALGVALDNLRPRLVAAFRRGWGIVNPAGEIVGRALLALDQKNAESILRVMASDSAPEMRSLAARALGHWAAMHPAIAIPMARTLAADENWEVREVIANAFDDLISQTQPDFVYELMAEWVNDENANVRRLPTNALMRYGRKHPERVLELMERLIHDDSEYVRKNVAFCLQQSIGKVKHPMLGPAVPGGPARLLAKLDEWARDADWRARWIVATTLGNVWARDFADASLTILTPLACDENRRVRTAATKAIRLLRP